jgi:TPR repeat protein
MQDFAAASSSGSSRDPAGGAVSRGWRIPRLPLLIGVIGLGAMVTTGTWMKRRADARDVAEAQAIRTEVADLRADVTTFRQRIDSLRWNAARYRADAQAANAEPAKSWLNERAWRYDALLEEIDRGPDEARFAKVAAEIEALCRTGHIVDARQRMRLLPAIKFPPAAEFSARWSKDYARPLAQFSRQNPGYYRLLKENEPEIAEADVEVLKRELAAAGVENVTPQTILGFELLAAAVPPDDPLLADWTTLTTADDFFENPDAATLAGWRRAQQAVRAEDWATAVAQMQSILLTKVRTRQPFRAAYGRALLRNRPDDTAAAYPFLQEAALAGDREARVWISREDSAQGRFASALRWLEARIGDGESDATGPLLAIYAMDETTAPRDLAAEFGVLQKIVTAPDAPPLAWLLLGRLYEDGTAGEQSSPKALACYRRAAELQSEPAWLEVARCCLRGVGTPIDLDASRAWAGKAFAAGEWEKSVPMLTELMRRAPERTAPALQELFEHEQTAAPAGFSDGRTTAGGVAQLQMRLARYLDQKGMFGAAAKFYARSGSRDPGVLHRYAELTASHPCETCHGHGEIRLFKPCATCGGRGTVLCNLCDGRGYTLVPGAPPCAVCGGTGGMVQDGRAVVCAACSGTGKGKSSVTKRDCTHCAHGRVPCSDCENGQITVTKECPACHGRGSRSLADS